MRKFATAVLGLLLAAAPAAAQDYKPVDINFGFGWAFPSTDFAKSFDAGWNGTIGATYNIPNSKIGIQAEYIYTHMDGPDRQITLFPTPSAITGTSGLIESNHQMHIGSFNAIYKMHSAETPVGG